jgi:hypothetical protein
MREVSQIDAFVGGLALNTIVFKIFAQCQP